MSDGGAHLLMAEELSESVPQVVQEGVYRGFTLPLQDRVVQLEKRVATLHERSARVERVVRALLIGAGAGAGMFITALITGAL